MTRWIVTLSSSAVAFLQRIHLGATHDRIALHHMNQITERIDREQELGLPATFGPRLGALLPGGVQPLVAFRVGRSLVAVRRPRLGSR